MLQETKVTVNYDDQPEWIAEKFVNALTELGISVELISDPDATYNTYLMKVPSLATK